MRMSSRTLTTDFGETQWFLSYPSYIPDHPKFYENRDPMIFLRDTPTSPLTPS